MLQWYMNLKKQITIDDLSVEIVTKKIKNLNLRITPPFGNITLSAPHNYPEEKIHHFVRSKIVWIRKHRTKIQQGKWIAPLKYESGEEHYFLGRRYRLEVIERTGKPKLTLDQCHFEPCFDLHTIGGREPKASLRENLDSVSDSSSHHPSTMLWMTTGFGMTKTLESNGAKTQGEYCMRMFVRPKTGREKRQEILDAWYRQQLQEIIPGYVAQYESKMNVRVSAWGIKKMKTKWGTCNITRKRIWLNLELAKKPIGAIEQVVVHEMVHLLERKHTKRFYTFLEQFLEREEEQL